MLTNKTLMDIKILKILIQIYTVMMIDDEYQTQSAMETKINSIDTIT